MPAPICARVRVCACAESSPSNMRPFSLLGQSVGDGGGRRRRPNATDGRCLRELGLLALCALAFLTAGETHCKLARGSRAWREPEATKMSAGGNIRAAREGQPPLLLPLAWIRRRDGMRAHCAGPSKPSATLNPRCPLSSDGRIPHNPRRWRLWASLGEACKMAQKRSERAGNGTACGTWLKEGGVQVPKPERLCVVGLCDGGPPTGSQ